MWSRPAGSSHPLPPSTHPFPSPHPILEHGDFTLVLCKACFCRVWQTHGFGCEVPTNAPDRCVLVLWVWDCRCVTGLQSHFTFGWECSFVLMPCTFGILYFIWDFCIMNSWYAYSRSNSKYWHICICQISPITQIQIIPIASLKITQKVCES